MQIRQHSLPLVALALLACDGSVTDDVRGVDGGPITEGADASVEESLDPPVSDITTTVVHTADGLVEALAVATPGSVVYVADDAVIDLTGRTGIVIPGQVTLASGGGVGGVGGALLYTDTLDTMPLFSAGGAGVRFTGLRLRGPDQNIGATPYGDPVSRGISAKSANNLQVDHSELYGWAHAAIALDYTHRAHVHHNNIHHNRRTGLGYGVVLINNSDVLVERNRFDYNRHAIAGTGLPGVSYEARYNLIGANRNGHAFDMHGEDEAKDNGSPYAGDSMSIHHNSFLGTAQGIVIRGRPKLGAYIHDNCFAQSSSAGTAIIQRYFFGNLQISNNDYSQPSGTCHVGDGPSHSVRSDVNGDGLADVVTIANGSVHSFLGSPTGALLPAQPVFDGTLDSALNDGVGHTVIDLGDVNGDGHADLVTAHDSGTVYVYRGKLGGGFGAGVESFNGTYTLGEGDYEAIAVADVDGDGFADLVSQRGGTATVHPGGADGTFGNQVESFNGTLNSASLDGTGHFVIDVADVTGDGRADLITGTDAGDAYVFAGLATGAFGSGVASFAGTFRQAFLDGQGFEPVAVADVTGDGRADLISAHTSGTTYVYPGTASGAFTSRADSFAGTMPTSLFGERGFEVIAALDIHGDGHADLVTLHPDRGIYVYPGTSAGTFSSSQESFVGELRGTRSGQVGYEPANEKSLLRRRGCAATGCL